MKMECAKSCENCGHSYDINNKTKMRCVYHDKYPKKTDCCNDWGKRSNDLVNREMAYLAAADAKSILLGCVMINRLPSAGKEGNANE